VFPAWAGIEHAPMNFRFGSKAEVQIETLPDRAYA